MKTNTTTKTTSTIKAVLFLSACMLLGRVSEATSQEYCGAQITWTPCSTNYICVICSAPCTSACERTWWDCDPCGCNCYNPGIPYNGMKCGQRYTEPCIRYKSRGTPVHPGPIGCACINYEPFWEELTEAPYVPRIPCSGA